jgi:hypothetical protein
MAKQSFVKCLAVRTQSANALRIVLLYNADDKILDYPNCQLTELPHSRNASNKQTLSLDFTNNVFENVNL